MNNRIYYSREAEEQANQERTRAVLIFMVLGLGIGAVLALLFAPKSGEETRHDISKSLDDRFSGVEKELESLSKRVEERLSR